LSTCRRQKKLKKGLKTRFENPASLQFAATHGSSPHRENRFNNAAAHGRRTAPQAGSKSVTIANIKDLVTATRTTTKQPKNQTERIRSLISTNQKMPQRDRK
jgi:hypothetical protein